MKSMRPNRGHRNALVGVGICCAMVALWVLLRHDWTAAVPAQLMQSCTGEMTPELLSSLPEHALYELKGTSAVVACHKSGDTVCNSIRRSGEHEAPLVRIMRAAAVTLSSQHRLAVTLLRKRDARLGDCVGRDKEGSVVYVDVGGNVGAFALSMMSYGFDTIVFEAMPANHALLTLGSCLSRGGAGAGRWELHHVALGPGGPDAKRSESCVILSKESNFGDGAITCDPAVVQRHQAALNAKKPLKDFRSMVQLSSLDSQLFGGEGEGDLRGLLAYEPAACIDTAMAGKKPATPNIHNSINNGESYVVRRSPQVIVSESWSTDRLARYVADRPVVMKIDVEGFEHMVMRGASRFLASAATKPTVLLSEVWLWKPEILEYIRELIVKHEYAIYFIGLDRWVRFVEDVQRIATGWPEDKVENAVFVQPGYEHVVETNAPY